MMAHSGRDLLMLAALAIANQDRARAGETCLRRHSPRGWLEGRSAPEDGTAMNADDRQGVQCSICHRLVDPVASPENPVEDGPILAALLQPVPAFGSAMMVVDPEDRLRGPFDIIGDLGSDPVPRQNPIRRTSGLRIARLRNARACHRRTPFASCRDVARSQIDPLGFSFSGVLSPSPHPGQSRPATATRHLHARPPPTTHAG